ncbi:MAG: hypothetical protein FWE99_00185 [Bacteroidales bacterium]|nr:hypothetical protein [Bacteroidales bacterium]
MKRILGLDLGTNSIGWALVEHDFEAKIGEILGLGSRIIPMGQDILGKFDAGTKELISQKMDSGKFSLIDDSIWGFLLNIKLDALTS